MTNKPPPRSVPLKKRMLNIVYFLDSSKSRSFQVSLRSALLFLAVFLGIQIWALGGIFTNSQSIMKIQLLSNENKDLRKSLFEYQTRYDGAYAVAYPESESSPPRQKINTAIAPENLPTEKLNQAKKLAAKATDATKVNEEIPMDRISEHQKMEHPIVPDAKTLQPKKVSPLVSPSISTSAPTSVSSTPREAQKSLMAKVNAESEVLSSGKKSSDEKSPGVSAASPSGSSSAAGSAPNSANARSDLSSEGASLQLAINSQESSLEKKNGSFPQISNAKVEKKEGKYLVRFELRSIPANTQLSGHLWLVGEFEREGKKVFYTSPKSVQVDESGMIKATQAGERYRVRNFTAKFLTLTVDATKSGDLRKMSIGISDEAGNQTVFPIDLTMVSGELGQRSKGG